MDKSLTQFYDELKTELDTKPQEAPLMNVGGPGATLQNSPGALAWRNTAAKECESLKDGCAKKLLLDIYCKVIPLDSDYVNGNQGVMKNDIDKFLGSKNMTTTQYFTSGYEKTNCSIIGIHFTFV